MPINKDQSIVMQVSAKIASELTPKGDDVNQNIVNFLTAFDAVTEIIFNAHGFNDQPASTPAPMVAETTTEQATAMVANAFPNATVTPTVRIKGKQHGPIPEWLATQCAAKGVTEVWDNRDGLAQNPKRPWFKSTSSEDAFWAPRG